LSITTNDFRDAALDVCRIRVPQAVVYRSFVQETVVLNLDTGRYHGVNPVGGRMLETLDRLGSLHKTAQVLAGEYDRPVAEIEADLREFCESLIERGLLVAEPS